MRPTNRRTFAKQSSFAVAGAPFVAVAPAAIALGANARIGVGVIGCGGRGSGLARAFAAEKDAALVAVCDPDEKRCQKAAKAAGAARAAGDLRRVLDDRAVDAVVVATPDHWHAPAAILACQAGKHVYVEKPCSHNLREGQMLVGAARKHNRVVQHGTQSRSDGLVAGAVKMLRDGLIGDVLVAKAWNVQRRGGIGHARPSDPPAGVDYDMWLGPAPSVPFQKNRFHYSWHWWYAFGTGDAGNDGVHELDYARWGLGVETLPSRVVGLGGKYYFDDDQQFPDTMSVTFEYPGDGQVGSRRMLIYEHRIWSPNHPHNVDNGAEFYGTRGRMMLSKRGKVEVQDDRKKSVEVKPERPEGLLSHHADFLDAIRAGRKPGADVETGHLSASLAHLGNIAVRLGRALQVDPQRGAIEGDDEAQSLLGREYRPGHWAVPKGAGA